MASRKLLEIQNRQLTILALQQERDEMVTLLNVEHMMDWNAEELAAVRAFAVAAKALARSNKRSQVANIQVTAKALEQEAASLVDEIDEIVDTLNGDLDNC